LGWSRLDLLDEDLFERGLHDLKAGDARVADGLGEQRLGVVGESAGEGRSLISAWPL
jgi:hypothetical protein